VVGEFRLDQSVAFVTKHAQGGLVDPMAGTGYWAYLPAQVGVNVVCWTAPKRWHFTPIGRYSFRGHPLRRMSARAY